MSKLFVELFRDNEDLYTSVESFLVMYIYKYLGAPEGTQVIYYSRQFSSNENKIKLNKDALNFGNIVEDVEDIQRNLRLPVFSRDNTFISGMCAVCREIVKHAQNPCRKDLLGFKEGCLLAPSECSVWTKFCEIDITSAVERLLVYNFSQLKEEDNFKLPETISRFESHMNQPVRVHNLYKVIQDEAKKTMHKSNDKSLSHRFAEGYFFTLADLILFPCFTLLFDILPHKQKLKSLFPLTFKWIDTVETHDRILKNLFYELTEKQSNGGFKDFQYQEEDITKTSLYKCDPKRYKPRDRIFTRQENIEESLLKLSTLDVVITSNYTDKIQKSFDWSIIEDNTYPNFGDIPENRLPRKKQQLENLVCAVKDLASDNDIIVDFCSGSGHLGILLAAALPNCHIIFLENKSRSLERAQKRAKEMNLDNCSFYQSNIDYFEGPFNIGTSLHACGTATDIVLKHCIKHKAKFVCCPCCYGSINPMPHITYPLSKMYKSALTEKDYLFIAHAADQSHNIESGPCNEEKSVQGQFCMDAIDTDRKLMAEEVGYKVVLRRLKPEDCTTKNRLLIGSI